MRVDGEARKRSLLIVGFLIFSEHPCIKKESKPGNRNTHMRLVFLDMEGNGKPQSIVIKYKKLIPHPIASNGMRTA